MCGVAGSGKTTYAQRLEAEGYETEPAVPGAFNRDDDSDDDERP